MEVLIIIEHLPEDPSYVVNVEKNKLDSDFKPFVRGITIKLMCICHHRRYKMEEMIKYMENTLQHTQEKLQKGVQMEPYSDTSTL